MYINPRIDIAFKKIFGVEENKDLLMSLINSIVSEEDHVEDLILLNPYNPKNFVAEKLSILDIKAEGIDGKRFNIEIQLANESNYDKRALYYWSKLYAEQLKAGDSYSRLNKTIGIHILDFTSIVGVAKYHNVFQIKEKDSNMHYFKDLELHTIELSKFANNDTKLNELVANIHTSLDLWSAFLTRCDLVSNIPSKPHTIDRALDVLSIMSLNEVERENYEGRMKFLRLEHNLIEQYIKIQEDELIAKGKEEGEKNKAIQIAKNLILQDMDIKTIFNVTGLSEDEIMELMNKD